MADEFVEKALLKARVLGLKIRNRISSTEGKSIEVNLSDVALSTGVGIMTFPLCVGALQTGVFRPLRMTSNIRVIGSVCGSISALISGGAASLAFLASAVMLTQVKDNSVFVEKFLSFVPVEKCSIAISVCSKDNPIYGFASLFVFKGPLKYLLMPLLGKNQLAITLHMYASIGPNLDNTHRGQI